MNVIINVKSFIIEKSTSSINFVYYSLDDYEYMLLNKTKNKLLNEKEKYKASYELKTILKNKIKPIKKNNNYYLIKFIIYCCLVLFYYPFRKLYNLLFDNSIEKQNFYFEERKKNLKRIYFLMGEFKNKKEIVTLQIFGDHSFISLSEEELTKLKNMAIGNIVENIFFLKKNIQTSTHEIFDGVPLLFYEYEYAIKIVGNKKLFKFIFNTPSNGERLLIDNVKLLKEEILVKIPNIHFVIGLPSSGKHILLKYLLKPYFDKSNVVIYSNDDLDLNKFEEIRQNIYDFKNVFIVNSKLCNVNYFNEVILNLRFFDKDSIKIFGIEPNLTKSIENLKKKENDVYLFKKKIENIMYLENIYKINNFENIELINIENIELNNSDKLKNIEF